MSGFVRRYTSEPSLEIITQIEGIVIIDLAPPPPQTGAGSGAVLLVGEFEDGPFATTDGEGVLEVFGSTDYRQKFGGLGFEYDSVPSSNPCARKHVQELWNGNGFLKSYKLRAQRLMCARVDTSVGSVSIDPVSSIEGAAGPYALAAAQQLAFTTNIGGPTNSTALIGAARAIAGIGQAFAGILSGDTIGIRVDGGVLVNVVFSATDITAATCAARINTALGYTCAVVNGAEVDLYGIIPGSAGSVELVDTVPGTAAKLGQVVGLWGDRARVNGGATNLPGIAAADIVSIALDGAAPVLVTFAGTPASAAAAVAVINAQVGKTVAHVLPSGRIRLAAPTDGLLGLASTLTVALGVPDAAADLGFGAATTTGVNTVGNVNAVTAAEVAAIVNGTAGLAAINAKAEVTASGSVRFYNSVAGGTIKLASGDMALAIGVPAASLGVTVSPTGHLGGVILAGTRVRTAGGLEWVTMQSLVIPAADPGPWAVKVRPALDDGTAVGTALGTAVVLTDQPDFTRAVVNNAAALAAAKTEPQMDALYAAAFDVTLGGTQVSREANFSLCARRSDAVVRMGLQNALDATTGGLLARKFIAGDPIGTTVAQSIANLAVFQSASSDRMFYTAKGWKLLVPEIAAVGVAGGLGFTDDGVITVRPDGPLTTLCAMLNPEENPGQQTGLIESFFAVDAAGETLDIEAYIAWKAAGIAAPRRDRVAGSIYESGVTSCTDAAKTTMARRKMADFIQDTAAELLMPYVKKLNGQAQRDAVRGVWEAFLSGLESAGQPSLARIVRFSVDDSVNAGNTDAVLALGVYYLETRVRILSSMDDIVVRTEIGEGVVLSTEV